MQVTEQDYVDELAVAPPLSTRLPATCAADNGHPVVPATNASFRGQGTTTTASSSIGPTTGGQQQPAP